MTCPNLSPTSGTGPVPGPTSFFHRPVGLSYLSLRGLTSHFRPSFSCRRQWQALALFQKLCAWWV